MKFIACIQLLSAVWSINGRISSVRELQSVLDVTPEEPQQLTMETSKYNNIGNDNYNKINSVHSSI